MGTIFDMTKREAAIEILTRTGRPMKVSELGRHGISRDALHRLAREGVVERAGAGVYRLPETTSIHADWAALALRHPEAVICTHSAASFHRTTQEMPAAIHVAVPHGTHVGRSADSFPVQLSVHRWRAKEISGAFTAGVETHLIDNVPVRITDPERTLVDMFRYSVLNKSAAGDSAHVDAETFLDCMQKTVARPDFNVDRLDRYIAEFGVGKTIDPYIRTALYTLSSIPLEHLRP